MDKIEDYLEIAKENPIALGVIFIATIVFLSLLCCCCCNQNAKVKKSKSKSKKSGSKNAKPAQPKPKPAFESVKLCKYCKVKIISDSVWQSHVVSKKHLKNTKETEKSKCLVELEDTLTVLC